MVHILCLCGDSGPPHRVAQSLERRNSSVDVTTETDPEDVLARLEESEIDCVVSCYDLPGSSNGLDVMERVRASHPGIPFVLFVGDGDEGLASNAISAGVTDYVPDDRTDDQLDALANSVESAVDGYRSGTRAAGERSNHLSALFENTADPIVEVTFDGKTPRIADVNVPFEEVFGFEEETAIRRSVTDLLVPDSERDGHFAVRDEVLGNRPVERTVIRETTDGVRQFDLRIIPIVEDGQTGGAYAWYTDVTEQKVYEQRLERLNEASHDLMTANTETEVAEVTIEIARHILDQPLTAMWSFDAESEALRPLAATDSAVDIDSSREAAVRLGPIPAGTREMEIFHDGDVVVLQDYAAVDDPAHPETPLGSVLVVPLGSYGQVHVGRRTDEGFDATTRDLVELLCHNAEAALERVHREGTLSDLNELTSELVQSSTREELAARATEAGNDVLGLPHTHIYLTDETGDLLEPMAVTEKTKERFGDMPRFHRSQGLFWEVLESGEPQLYDDVQTEAEMASDLPFRGAVIAPLGEKGVIASGSLQAAKFDPLDKKHASILAATAEATLDRIDRETRLRDHEKELKEARNRFRSVFEHSNDAIVVFDPELDEILVTNSQASDLLGYSREELRSVSPSEIHPHEMAEFRDLLDVVRREGSGRTERLSCLTKSGERVRAEISVSALTFDGRDAVLAMIRDVSDLRQYERTLERQNERLEEFAAVLSHDLRNPLNVAMARIELAEAETESEDLATARSALDRMEAMIDDVLTLTRIGDPVEETEPVALDSLVRQCWQTVDTSAVDLVGSTGMTVRADESRLRHVFENLFRNAVEHGSTSPPSSSTHADDEEEHSSNPASQTRPDATGGGGTGVTITVGALQDADGFFVADSGPGIPPDERDDVFEHGFSTTEDGMGFGLNIVREIVEAHGWEIGITESADGGARFEITGVESTE